MRTLAYDAIKKAITEMDIYGHPDEIRLDERQLSQDLGVSRTPIREALTLLEQEGFVRSVPRRGMFVVRKSKREIIDMILVWAALESMAARLAAERASEADLEKLQHAFDAFQSEPPEEHPDEYSQANIRFHQTIIRLGGCELIGEMTENLFIHMRAIRAVSMRQQDRAAPLDRRAHGDHRGAQGARRRAGGAARPGPHARPRGARGEVRGVRGVTTPPRSRDESE